MPAGRGCRRPAGTLHNDDLCYAYARTRLADGAESLNISLNDTGIGQIDFAQLGKVGSLWLWSGAGSTQAVAPGDVIRETADSSPDVGLANVSVSLLIK